MKTSDMIRQLCEQMNMSVSELARRLGQSPQNFGKKLKRETITLEELKAIADVMDVKQKATKLGNSPSIIYIYSRASRDRTTSLTLNSTKGHLPMPI